MSRRSELLKEVKKRHTIYLEAEEDEFFEKLEEYLSQPLVSVNLQREENPFVSAGIIEKQAEIIKEFDTITLINPIITMSSIEREPNQAEKDEMLKSGAKRTFYSGVEMRLEAQGAVATQIKEGE